MDIPGSAQSDQSYIGKEEVVDDVEASNEKEHDGLTKDDICQSQKVSSMAIIASLHFKTMNLPCCSIPLCRLVAMLIVRPTFFYDLVNLEQEFIYG